MWNTLEAAKLIVSFSTPVVVVALGYYFSHQLKQFDRNNEARRQKELEAKEGERNELERKYKLRVEFTIDAIFHGNQNGSNLVEVVATINNKSAIQHKFTAINLRALGIKKGESIDLWSPTILNKQIATKKINFPEKILKESLIPPQWNYIFVEPGVKQEITYPTSIPENISYILATVEFHYDANTPHTAEHMFKVKVASEAGDTHE
ncbi:MAG: Unknown protein [uncultured Thiotrichaceae bacterium]|uniref:Uncharacterized protein n=1 Tax=uncultured Thiotrichaceae bacterium TaxID=298394 RepID=A0A6S6SS30_9GAMM|nr:MAG: Unknown protein [uncultured Thiotrichaceae bacterium]